MKLGNQGFGLKEMIIVTCLLALLLIFVSIQINSLYKSVEENRPDKETQEIQSNTPEPEPDPEPIPDTVDYNYYRGLETRLKLATQNYLDANPYELGSEIITIDATTLINLEYLTPLYAQDNTSVCQGYSNVYEQNGNIVISPYITCYNYQTANN